MSDKTVTTTSADQTMQLGIHIGKNLKGGEVIELNSDLGGGKTTITKGIVAGLGSDDLVSSPTFTISNVYTGHNLEIHHYDFYRLGDLGIMIEELQEAMSDPHVVSVIEWAGEAHDLLPVERLIRISILPVRDNESMRDITISTANDEFLKRVLEESSL